MKTRKKKNLIAPVTSLAELFQLAATDDRYAKLAFAACSNLGGGNPPPCWQSIPERRSRALAQARQWLDLNAMESGDDGEIVAEINFCRDTIFND